MPSLYIHIPFCASRCGYCTFTSNLYSQEKANTYLTALEKELRTYNLFNEHTPPQTIFIGGGTPSILTLPQLKHLFSFLPKTKEEFTCEINPDSCSKEKLQFLQTNGVTRLSFGVQTFDPTGLRLLQRRHTQDQAIAAVEMAVEMNFNSVSIDLINGWPGQTEECVREDIKRATELGIRHLSNYNLILEPSAPEYTHYCDLLGGEIVDEETGRRNWEITEEMLESKGFTHYETSNFSLPGYQCAHNVLTWKGGEYLGIGLAACSHIGGVRWENTGDFDAYCRGGRVSYSEKLEDTEKARECAVFWLRLFEGVETGEFKTRTGMDFFELYKDILPGAVKDGTIIIDGEKVRVPKKFHPILDSIVEMFV